MDSATSDNLTRSGRRRSLIQSASRKFSNLGQPKSRKTRLPNEEEQTSQVKISPPFDFRDLSNSSSSSNNSRSSHAQAPTLQSLRQKDNQYHGSPLDKPLPSLPVATIITSSPVKVRRSLIDAQEKPLRRSLSPQHQAFEEWPSLSPQKQCSSPVTLKMPTPIKPSISESLTERIKKLNLEDNTILLSKDKANKMSKSNIPIESSHTKSPRLTPVTKSATPVVRHNKTSELRLRLSAETSEAQKRMSANVSSPLSNISTTVTNRSRSIKRSGDAQRGRVSIAHSRSRSRHRVTAEGSPYVLPVQDASESHENSDHKIPLTLDSSKVDTDFTGSHDDAHVSKNFRASPSARKSSIPIPKRQQRDFQINDAEVDFESHPQFYHVSDASKSYHNSDEKGQVKTDPGRRKASPFPSLTISHTNGIEDVESFSSQSETGRQMLVDEELNQSKNYTAQHSDSTTTSPASQSTSTNGNNPNTEFMSTIKNEHGPILRISTQADEMLQNHKFVPDGPVKNRDCMQGHHLISDSIKSGTKRFYSTFGPDDILDRNSTDALNQIDADEYRIESGPHGIPRKPVPSHPEVDEYQIKPSALIPLSEIRQDPGFDGLTTSGWPFRESLVAPFKTLDIPEREADGLTLGLMSATQDRSESGSSQLKSIQGSNENTKEAIENITSIQRSGTQRSILANTHAEMHAATMATNKPNVFSTYSSLRPDNGGRMTGLRTPSARAPTFMINERSPQSAPVVKTSSTPQYMKSFHRSTQNITVAGPPSGKNIDKPIPSPVPTTGSVSTGKGVINNIRGLFHKRSNLRSSVTASVHRPTRYGRPSNSAKVSPLSPTTTLPTLSSQVPRSPQVKRTSSLVKRAPPSRHFPTSKVVRPLGSLGPVETEDEPSTTVTNTDHKKEKPTKTEAKPKTPVPSKLKNDVPEIESATDLVHRLLDRAQEYTTPYRTAEQFLELAKTLVTILTAARDAEKSLESAKMAVSKCEMRCVEIRKEVGRVDSHLRKMVGDLDLDGNKF